MKVRLPQQPSQQEMLKRVQKLQEEMEQTQKALNEKEYEISSGGGLVTVKINGKKEIISIKIKPEAVDPDDIEMLEDILTAAVNEAVTTVEKTNEEEMGKLTGGLNLPGLGL